MNRKLFSVLVVAVMLMQLLCGFSAVSAADADKTVVFVKDDGTGDGSSPENAAPTLMDAYNYLDLSKDCTVVICGPCTLWEAFDYGAPYEGSVTITSVYNGIDWRAANDAVLQVMFINIVWRGDTTLSYMDLECISDKGVHVDCQFNDFTIDYGVNIIGDHLSGLTDSSSIFVVGGYQSGKGEYVAGESPLDRDVNLKFYSGYNILVNIWSRGVSNETYTGKATVLFSGTSEGSVFVAGLKTSGCTFGDTDLIIEDEALVYNIYGTASVDANEKSFDCYWYGGELLTCIDSYRDDGKFITFLEGRKLYASDAAKQGAVYDEISAWFDTVESVTAPEVPEHTPPVTEAVTPPTTEPPATEPPATEPPATEPPATEPPATEPPATDPAPATDPVAGPDTEPADVQTTVPVDEPKAPAENDGNMLPIIIGVAAVVIVIVAVVILVKKKK